MWEGIPYLCALWKSEFVPRSETSVTSDELGDTAFDVDAGRRRRSNDSKYFVLLRSPLVLGLLIWIILARENGLFRSDDEGRLPFLDDMDMVGLLLSILMLSISGPFSESKTDRLLIFSVLCD